MRWRRPAQFHCVLRRRSIGQTHGNAAPGFSSANCVEKQSSSCPGDKASPGDWGYGNSSQVSGEAECEISSEGYPTIIWSDISKLRVGVVEGKGQSIDALFKWWSDKS